MTPRDRLPNRRRRVTHKLGIVDAATGVRHRLFLGVGLRHDGTPAEVWIDSSKDGTTLRGFMADFAKLVSIALQRGVPLAELSHAFRGIEYPPFGSVEGHAKIESATSPIDLLMQVLECETVKA